MSATGKILEIFASKTSKELEKDSFGNEHPGAIGFPTDSTKIRFNNKWYGGDDSIKPYQYKGTYATLSSLFSGVKSANVGDVYNIESSFNYGGKQYPAGTNVAVTTEFNNITITDINFSDYFDPLGGERDVYTKSDAISDSTKIVLNTEITAGELDGKPISEIVDTLFFPTLYPSLVSSSIPAKTLSVPATLVEYNSPTLESNSFAGVTSTPTAAKINPIYRYTNGDNQLGDVIITKSAYSSVVGNTGNTNKSSETVSVTITYSPETKVNFPLDSKGNPYTSVAYSGSTQTLSKKIEAFYPIYIPDNTNSTTLVKGTLVKSNVSNNDVTNRPSNSDYPNTYAFETTSGPANKRVMFAVMSTVTPVVYGFNTMSNKYEAINSVFASETFNVTLNDENVAYTKYYINDSGNLGANKYAIFYKATLNP